jgi:hypothetical protein
MMEHTAVDGSPLAPESLQMIEYLKKRAAELTAVEICHRVRSAAQELEDHVSAVPPDQARRRPIAGKWTIAEVVDHISQTQIRGAEELRHLLAGRRPPLPPVYEALRSGAGEWAPWEVLVGELHQANRSMIEVLETAIDTVPVDEPKVRTVMVALCKLDDGTQKSQIWFADLPWKQYALLQRLHLLDHRTQIKKLFAALSASA